MILAVGDSFTYGSELPDAGVRNGERSMFLYEHPSKLAWPSLLAQRLNTTVDNLAIPGGSNDRIYRLAVSESLKTKYDFVFCAWSILGRLDITYKNIDFPITPMSHWHLEHFPWIKNFYAEHFDYKRYVQTWMTQIITLQEYFKSQGQKFLFLNITKPNWTNHKSMYYYNVEHFFDLVDIQYFLGWPNEAMTDWMGDCAKGPGGHPLELGHERIADKIYEHIRSLGWLS